MPTKGRRLRDQNFLTLTLWWTVVPRCRRGHWLPRLAGCSEEPQQVVFSADYLGQRDRFGS